VPHRRFIQDNSTTVTSPPWGRRSRRKDSRSTGHGGADVDMTIWDIMGERIPLALERGVLPRRAGVLAVCDVTRKQTLDDLDDWSPRSSGYGKCPDHVPREQGGSERPDGRDEADIRRALSHTAHVPLHVGEDRAERRRSFREAREPDCDSIELNAEFHPRKNFCAHGVNRFRNPMTSSPAPTKFRGPSISMLRDCFVSQPRLQGQMFK